MELPSELMELPSELMELPSELMELPAELMELPAELMELPAELVELPAELMELPLSGVFAEPPSGGCGVVGSSGPWVTAPPRCWTEPLGGLTRAKLPSLIQNGYR